VYIGNNYFVKFSKLSATDVLLVRGIIQVAIFSAFIAGQQYCRSRKQAGQDGDKQTSRLSKKLDGEEDERQHKSQSHKQAAEGEDDTKRVYTHKVKVCLVVYSVLMASISFSCLLAISMMPIGDLIVISFASPAFSVFLSRWLLGTPLTLLSVALSFLILVGDTLVAQPPFLFGGEQDKTSLYYIGVALCLYVAVSSSLADIASTYCSKAGVSTSMLMIGTGLASIIVSISGLAYSATSLWGLVVVLQGSLAYLVGSGLMVMLAFWWVAAALALTRSPTLVAMLRSTEILLAMFTESAINTQLPDALSCSGSLLVLLCVLCMSCHDNVVQYFKQRRRKGCELKSPL